MIKRITAMLFIAMIVTFSFAGSFGYEASANTAGANTSLQGVGTKTDNKGAYQSLNISLSSSDKEKYLAMMTAAGTGDRYKVVLRSDAPSDFTTTTLVNTGNVDGASINLDAFRYATDGSRRLALENYVYDLQNSGMSEQGQQAIINGMQAGESQIKAQLIPILMASTSADIYTAMKWIAPFLPIIRVVLGLGAIVITILLVASTVFDLVFIGLPLAREGIMNNDGGKGKPNLISADAYSVIKETESGTDSSGGYKNAYIMYFKRRALTYIVLSVCLLYLVAGEMSGLIAWLMSLADGIVATGSSNY